MRIILCGAGLSASASLPLARDLRTRALRLLTAPLVSTPALEAGLTVIANSQLPLEVLLEVVVTRFGRGALECLAPLRGSRFGVSHDALALLAGSGNLRAILTVNFDELIEAALEAHGWIRGRDFSVVLGIPDTLPPPKPLPLIKLHGTISDADSLIATLSQVGNSRKHSAKAVNLFRELGSHQWVVAGYRGADWDLRAPLEVILREREGTWCTRTLGSLEDWVGGLLSRASGSWRHEPQTADAFLSQLAGRSFAPASAHAGPAAPDPGYDWCAEASQPARIKTVSDLLAHLGRYLEVVRLLDAYATALRGPQGVPLLVSLAHAHLSLDQLSQATAVEADIGRAIASPDEGPALDPGSKLAVEHALLQSSLFWHAGARGKSIALLEAVSRDALRHPASLTAHQQVRAFTYLAERLAESGDGTEGLSWCMRARTAAGTHLQLLGVAARTEALCQLSLGRSELAVPLVQEALPDLIADINGQIIAYITLAKALLAAGRRDEAIRAADSAGELALQTSHRARQRELKELRGVLG